MKRYRVAQVGCGKRGEIHVKGFSENPDRFEIVGLCDMDASRLAAVGDAYDVKKRYTDLETMLDETKPDVFCFVTLPHGRLSMVELAVKHRVQGLAFEKPMATSLREARAIRDLCAAHGIKAVVSHQQKYLDSMRKMKSIMDSGDIGTVETIHVKAVSWFSQLGTHLVDYALWMGGARARWVVGHMNGRDKLTDSHPSTDYLLGQFGLENGKRVIFESGYLAPRQERTGDTYDMFWTNNRLTAYGTHGYAWSETNGRWGAFTKSSGGSVIGGEFDRWSDAQRRLQTPYLAELADWLDDGTKVHSCNIETAYHGYEIIEGMCFSALDNTRIDLPLGDLPNGDVIDRAAREVPSCIGSDGFNAETKKWSFAV
ncbi:MAG: Gfo/Idh/MocA family oxidoreductase [Spirochaetota bacterium]